MMSKNILFYILLFLTSFSFTDAYAQKAYRQGAMQEAINYQQYMKENNLTVDQLTDLLVQRGVPQSEIDRIKASLGGAATAPSEAKAMQVIPRELPVNDFKTYQKPPSSNVFGASFFTTPSLAFEPNLRIATPVNYILGPDDELLISISGYQEANYRITVQPEGSIVIPQVGVISVAGQTIEQATQTIRKRMIETVYPNLSNGLTRLNITLGKIRSIHVTIIGAAKPGTYTVSSLTTTFNSLYLCGGPDSINTYREIELIRGNRVYRKIDLYQFLTRGDMSGNVLLKEGDVINFPVYKKRVTIKGEVKRPGVFELLENESLDKLLFYAGGLTSKAFKSGVRIKQSTETERKIRDVSKAEYTRFQLANGDEIIVDAIPERLENGVAIAGAVYRPGQFEFTPGLTLSALLKKAGGVQEDAFLDRGILSRLNENRTKESISFKVSDILSGARDINLQKWDQVEIASVTTFMTDYTVSVSGEVRKPGNYPYRRNLTLKDVLFLAGNFTDAGTAYNIEVGRRLTNDTARSATDSISRVFTVNANKDLSFSENSFQLLPFDIITVRRSPGYQEQKRVSIEGEVLYPGAYTIKTKQDRISDLLNRAGGLTTFANREGVALIRKQSAMELADTIRNKQVAIMQKSIRDTSNKVIDDMRNINIKIALDADKILRRPGSKEDYILEEGDVVQVTKLDPLVKISGEVLAVSKTNYEVGRSVRYYFRRAGGLSENARRRKTYIVYANGELDKTRSIIFGLIKNYPEVKSGSEIVVPGKSARRSVSVGETVGITASIASIFSVIVITLTLLK